MSESGTSGRPEHRVEFDFQIDFSNGGGLQGQGFRLDIPGDDIADIDIAARLVRKLGLLMVGEVRITSRTFLTEPHRRRSTPDAGAVHGSPRLIELSHVIRDGLVTYPGLPAPVITDHLSFADSRSVYAPGTGFRIGRIDMVANTGTYLDTPARGIGTHGGWSGTGRHRLAQHR